MLPQVSFNFLIFCLIRPLPSFCGFPSSSSWAPCQGESWSTSCTPTTAGSPSCTPHGSSTIGTHLIEVEGHSSEFSANTINRKFPKHPVILMATTVVREKSISYFKFVNDHPKNTGLYWNIRDTLIEMKHACCHLKAKKRILFFYQHGYARSRKLSCLAPFFLPPYTQGERRKTLFGFEPRSSCFTSNRSNH